MPGLGWISELALQVQQRRLDNLSDLGGMMGSRFEIWSAVRNMFTAFPLMGVGEGDFYRLSSVISFAKSEFLNLNQGENAHNYFLQVIAENGLIGFGVFVLLFILPYRAIRVKSLALPALIGIISLFLGNIFAHSFLVRENLLLCAALLGLLYVFSNDESSELGITLRGKKTAPVRRIYLVGASLLTALIMILVAREIHSSFGRSPFKYGSDCFVKELPLFSDGWTSGAWEELLPKGKIGIELNVIPNRLDLMEHPLELHFEILSWEYGKGKVRVANLTQMLTSNEVKNLRLEMPRKYLSSKDVISTRLQLSSCYTPRNLGANTDGRRLGLQILQINYLDSK